MSLEQQARDALERDDLLGATQAAKAIVLQDRDAPVGYFLLAIAAEQAGQIDNAVLLLDAAVQRGPDEGLGAEVGLGRRVAQHLRDGVVA